MAPSLPIREGEPPPDDVVVVIRAGVMGAAHIEHAASQCLDLRGVLAISVEAVLDTTVAEACANSPRLSSYRQLRLSSFGRLPGCRLRPAPDVRSAPLQPGPA